VPSRRDVVKSMGIAATAWLPGVSYAVTGSEARVVLVILRGAADGLAIVAPYGDGGYRLRRGRLALDAPGPDGGLLKLDGLFGLHPSMAFCHSLYTEGELLPVHAVASPYRERSHFDGQDVLENGATQSGERRDGWLNRAIAPLGGVLGNEQAIAMTQNTPLVLRGDNSVTSWAPSRLPDTDEDTLRRIEAMYATDEFFATRFAQAIDSQTIADDMPAARGRLNERQQSRTLMQAAGRFLAADDGPRIAVLESGGWDTHANQGAATGGLANRLAALDEDLGTLRAELGGKWSSTVVAVVTEFGRTAAVNGTGGTDHGTATAALLLGGAVRGGRVLADWPGLRDSDLYQGRDLYPTMDLRGLFKAVLIEHLHLPDNFVEDVVFPGSGTARPPRDIVAG